MKSSFQVLTHSNAKVILSIQYLRGIAALMVVWHHALSQIPNIPTLLKSNIGSAGVDIFFVISGFIMVVSNGGTNSGIVKFCWRRFVRIVPLYWILTLAKAAVWALIPNLFRTLEVSTATLVQSLFFIPHYSTSFPDNIWPLLVPGWSLNYEMFFYAIFGLSLGLPARFRFLGLSLIFATLVWVGYQHPEVEAAFFKTYTNPILLEFVLGVLIAQFFLAGHVRLSLSTSIALIVLGIYFLTELGFQLLSTFSPILGAALVVFGMLNININHRHSVILRKLGDSSYSLYLTHIFTLGVMRIAWLKLFPDQTTIYIGLAFMLSAIVVSAFVGWIIFIYLEHPMTKRINQIFKTMERPKIESYK